MMEPVLLLRIYKYTAQQANICGALTGVEETSGEMVWQWVLESIPAPRRSQIKKEIKAFFSCPLEDDGAVMTERERESV